MIKSRSTAQTDSTSTTKGTTTPASSYSHTNKVIIVKENKQHKGENTLRMVSQLNRRLQLHYKIVYMHTNFYIQQI